ncbi:radical SAM protein [Candidatus Roizmanbacteria bacterium]|nr:radical SAM protein [Candidatus Roizmanbacteria bacterium]
MDFQEIVAKSILNKCGIPGIDFVINPYVGCRFACKYCYASFMGRFVGKKVSDWGEYVFAKKNAPELLRKELPRKLTRHGRGKEIFLSSVTDPYQGLEVKYRLTRGCLEALVDFGFQGTLSILTKSGLVTRDLDVLKKFKRAVVGLTVTSTDDSISRYFEKYAPPVSERLKTLTALNQNGLATYAFIGPLLPHFVAAPQELEKLIKALKATGTRNLFIEHLNLAPYIKGRLVAETKDVDRDILQKFYSSQSADYREKLNGLIRRLIKKYDMNLLLDMVIFHQEFQ